MHRPIARNYAAASENRIHSDEIAQRLGFTGALVPGVTVFGHLTWPLTRHFGAEWLTKSDVATRFLKPAYHGETLSITANDAFTAVEAHNHEGVRLATLECNVGAPPPVDARSTLRGSEIASARIPIEWETVTIDQPFAVFDWRPDAEHNRDYAARL